MNPGFVARQLRYVLTGLIGLPASLSLSAEPGPDVTSLTAITRGRAMRVVWCRETSPPATDDDSSREFLLMGYDSRDGEIRPLMPSAVRCFRPLLTPDGDGVVFTGLPPGDKPVIRILNWQNGAVRDLGTGVALATHKDAETGQDYVYALDAVEDPADIDLRGELVVRFLPASPDDREIVWSGPSVSAEGFQLSRDGARAGGFFPRPQTGVADLTNMSLIPGAHGSGSAFAPDDSYASLTLDPARRRMKFLAPDLDPGWEISVADLPGFQSAAIGYPRWTNDPAVIAFSGPPSPEPDGPAPGIFVMRLRDDLRRVESTVRLSTSHQEERYPDIRIEGSDAVVSALPQKPATATPAHPSDWPVAGGTPVFAWRNADPREGSEGTSQLTPGGFARPGRHFEMDLSAGWFEASPESGRAVAAACSGSGSFTIEFILTERRSEPPLSVRLITIRHPDGHDLFGLYRVDRRLVARILCGPVGHAADHPVILTSLAIQDDRPCHVALSFRGDRLKCYVDGQPVSESTAAMQGLAAWTDGRLFFGDPQPYGNPWTGWMERVALYSSALTDSEIETRAKAAATYLESRQRPRRVRVRAVMEGEPHSEPGRDDAADFLTATTWKVDQVLTGVLEERQISVVHWSRLNGIDVPNPFPGAGKTAEFTIEPPEDHPELQAARISSAAGTGSHPVWIYTVPPGRTLSAPAP